MNLGQMIKKLSLESFNSSSPLQFFEGVVHSAPPNIQIKLKDNPKLIIPRKFIRISEHLTRHSRTVNISSSNITSSLSRSGDPEHAHDVNSLSLNGATLNFTDELKKGDKIMVVAIQGGQSFFIIDRFVG